MSGPKVVHVVTREEVEAICRRWLLLVGDAAAHLGRVATRLGLMDAALQSRIDACRWALEGLMRSERWLDLQKEAPAAIEHFRAEAARLRDEAVAQAAAARSKRRRLVDAARSVSGSLAASGKAVPTALDEVIARAMDAPDAALGGMRGAVEAAIGSMSSGAVAAAKAERSGLAARLGADGEGPVSFAAWSSANVKPDARAERLDALLAELATRFPSTLDADALVARAASIGAEQSQDRRSLLTDSLILEVGRRVRDETALEAAVNDAATTRAELAAAAGEEARRRLEELGVAIAARDVAGIAAAAAAGEALLEAARRHAAAAARRRAVLDGLASLGYEVREGMEAAWAKEGRIVVQRPGAEDYGVELAAPPDASRLQARVVGSDRPRAARDARRDKDQETIWCGQFDRLRAMVAEGGGAIDIERAFAPGEQAVKTIPMPSPRGQTVETEGRPSAKPQARSLPRG